MKYLLVYILLIFCCISGFSQKSEYRLKLVDKQNPARVRYVNEGQRMKIYMNETSAVSGRIGIPSDSTLQLDSNIFTLDQLYRIKSNSAGFSMAKIASGAVFITGVSLVIISFVTANQLFRSGDVLDLIVLPFVIIYGGGGAAATIVSGSILFLYGKKYDLREQWEMSIVPVTGSETSR